MSAPNSRPACPTCGTWSPGDAVGDGSVLICRVCAERGARVVLWRRIPAAPCPVCNDAVRGCGHTDEQRAATIREAMLHRGEAAARERANHRAEMHANVERDELWRWR